MKVIRRVYDRGSFADQDHCLDELAVTSRDRSVDFLLAAMGSPDRIFEIKDGVARAGTTAWIASHDAFNMFQRKRAEVAAESGDVRSMLSRAFEQVIYAGLDGVARPAVCAPQSTGS